MQVLPTPKLKETHILFCFDIELLTCLLHPIGGWQAVVGMTTCGGPAGQRQAKCLAIACRSLFKAFMLAHNERSVGVAGNVSMKDTFPTPERTLHQDDDWVKESLQSTDTISECGRYGLPS